jgi:general secretion pathway protein J
MNRRALSRGLTLLEILVSISILALIATLIYGAFDGMSRARTSIFKSEERYHQGRGAIARMSRELQSAFLSLHQPSPLVSQPVRLTAFIGTNQGSQDRVDFNSFTHRRLGANRHESDQNELSYFLSRDPDRSDKYDLVRREAKDLDIDPAHGGVVNVLAEDVESFDLKYLDPITSTWIETWDSTQLSGQMNRLPLQVMIRLVIKGRDGAAPIKLETKIPVAMQVPLTFAK